MAKQPSEYARTTVRATAADLPPEVRELVRERALLHGIEEDPLGAGGTGIRTDSRPLKKGGLFRRVRESAVTALITTDALLVLTAAGDDPPALMIYRLDEIDVAEFSSPLIEDAGLDVTGLTRGATERHTQFIPVDQGADGTRFREELRDATEAART